jgi:hypothetical protein
LDGKIEGPKMTLNPRTNDLVLVYDNFQKSINKDIFIKVKTAQGWQKEVDISGSTQTPELGGVVAPEDVPRTEPFGQMGVQAPHGQLAETNAWVSVDETDGYVYMTWKADRWNEEKQGWELLIVVALLNPSYQRVWYARTTRDYFGFHLLPSIAARGGRAMMAFAWKPEGGYYYLTFVREGNSLIYDASRLYDQRIAACPLKPHWEFHNALVPHGDRFVFTYKDMDKAVEMYHYSVDGVRLDETPIDLANHEPSLWPHDCYSSPEVGLLTVWATPREGDPSIHYSLYDEPIALIQSPLNLRVETRFERSFFNGYYLNDLTWEANPANAAHDITISAHRIYRKPQGADPSSYALIGEVPGTTLTYTDSDNVSGPNAYDYAVTCVDTEGNESAIP